MTARLKIPAGDLVVEAEAECTFEASDLLEHAKRAQVPMLMAFGDKDEYFPLESLEETAAVIPDCTVVKYHGAGHMSSIMSDNFPQDVLAWVSQRDAAMDDAAPQPKMCIRDRIWTSAGSPAIARSSQSRQWRASSGWEWARKALRLSAASRSQT